MTSSARIIPPSLLAIALAPLAIVALPDPAGSDPPGIVLNPLGRYPAGSAPCRFDVSASEIPAYDPESQRLFVVNAVDASVDVLDISDPTAPGLLFSINAGPGVVNSVAVDDGVVAVAVQNTLKTDPGFVKFYDTFGNFLSSVTVGALPDMLVFTPHKHYVVVANEGEPNDAYTIDPEGSISIIDVHKGAANVTQADVRTADFTAFNGATLDPGIRIFGPGATVAQDLEPEYIAVSHDSHTAWVTLQENNAIAVVDIKNALVERVIGLGFKNHNTPGNGLDASDADGVINIANWPVFGMYQPDGIAAYHYKGASYLVTANEGDAREYTGVPGYVEAKRVNNAAVVLDPVVFPNAATLRQNVNLGKLNISTANGNTDGDSEFEALYAFGTRSFSIWREDGTLVFDSGDDFETKTAAAIPLNFNSNHTANNFDNRSDDKGPEPEGVAIGEAFKRTYAFVGLERVGGVMVYDITHPASPSFVQYINTRPFTGTPSACTAGDLGPEGLVFIDAKDSPTGRPLLVVAHEVSGTTRIFEIAALP